MGTSINVRAQVYRQWRDLAGREGARGESSGATMLRARLPGKERRSPCFLRTLLLPSPPSAHAEGPTTPSAEPGAQQKERPYRQSLSLPQGTCGPSREKASPLCTGHRSQMSSEKPILTPSDILMNKWRLDVTQGSETRAGRWTLPNTSFHLPSLEILDSTGDAPFAKPPLVGFGEASKIFRNDAKKAMKIPLPFSS